MSDLKNTCDVKQRQSSIVAFIKDSVAAKPKVQVRLGSTVMSG